MTERGGVFVVDEISARLHPLLTKLIIDIFQSSNNTKAQLIFTTHDVSLSDLKVRDDATFNKDYLQGKYGAIPIFNYDVLLEGDENG